MEIIIASKNAGKVREIKEELSSTGVAFKTFEEFPDWEDVKETGDTLEDNAARKARVICERYGCPAISDDSGLFVDALSGEPGVKSARFAGPEQDPEKNISLLLKRLEGLPPEKRKAKFICVIALALPEGGIRIARGECTGEIVTERRGKGGFGYDPVFKPDGYEETFAELPLTEKNRISHRGKALRKMKEIIAEICEKSNSQ